MNPKVVIPIVFIVLAVAVDCFRLGRGLFPFKSNLKRIQRQNSLQDDFEFGEVAMNGEGLGLVPPPLGNNEEMGREDEYEDNAVDVNEIVPDNSNGMPSREELTANVHAAIASGSAEDVVASLENLAKLPYDMKNKVNLWSYLTVDFIDSLPVHLVVRVVYTFNLFRVLCSNAEECEKCSRMFSKIYQRDQSYSEIMVRNMMEKFVRTRIRLPTLDPTAVQVMFDMLRDTIKLHRVHRIERTLWHLRDFGMLPGTMPIDLQQEILRELSRQWEYCFVILGAEVLLSLGKMKFDLSVNDEYRQHMQKIANNVIKFGIPRHKLREIVITLCGLADLGVTYDTCIPELKVTLRNLFRKFPFHCYRIATTFHYLGKLKLRWELFNYAEQLSIQTMVAKVVPGMGAHRVSLLFSGLGMILRDVDRLPDGLMHSLLTAVRRTMTENTGSSLINIIDGMVNFRLSMDMMAEEFQLDFQYSVDETIRKTNREGIVRLLEGIKRLKVDRNTLLPEIKMKLTAAGF